MTNFDAVAKEKELLAAANQWDTSSPVQARPGDVPIIDVGPYLQTGSANDRSAIADELRRASQEVGFHQVVGHGISADQQQQILAATGRFHALALADKRQILMDRPGWPTGGMGYLPLHERKLPRRAVGNANEAFLIKTDHHLSFDDNQWPADLPGFRETVESYATAIAALAQSLLPLYAVALDLAPDFFAEAFVDPFWRLRLTHYPGVDEHPDPADGAFGIAPHVDTTFFTLLLQDGPGLTIYSHQRNEWISVPVIDGALVVNSGELLRQWSNDRFLSTRHFANNVAPTSRYSVPFFFNANADFPMECLPSCHGPDNPPKYPTISYNQSQAVVQGE